MPVASPFYHLLAPAGVTPQVITETVYELHRREGRVPAAVHVVTTTTGAAAVRARLLGEDGHRDFRGAPLPPADAWAALWRDVLGREAAPVHVHVAERAGQPLADIRHPADDRAFAEACYALAARLTADDQPPLVGSISGGRKSMSAHVMNAFSALARGGDRLCHVLVAPPALEADRDFFYPTDPARQEVHLVELDFPRLRAVLKRSVLKGRAPRGFGDLVEAARPFLLAEQRPAAAELVLGDLGSRLRVFDARGDELGKVRLSEHRTATLLVLANALADCDGVAVETLYKEALPLQAQAHPVHQARAWLSEQLAAPAPEPWTESSEVSKTISDLRKGLKRQMVVARYFGVASRRDGVYRWPEPLPCALRIRLAPALEPVRDALEAAWTTHFPHLTYEWL